MGVNPAATEPVTLSNTGHPVSDRMKLAHAKHSQVHALGFLWDDERGLNYGQYAPFEWAA